MSQNETCLAPKSAVAAVLAPERRTLRRNRVLKGARIVFNAGLGIADATVHDLNERGARLKLGETTSVPGQFKIVIGRLETREAKVVWRKPEWLGIAFV